MRLVEFVPSTGPLLKVETNDAIVEALCVGYLNSLASTFACYEIISVFLKVMNYFGMVSGVCASAEEAGEAGPPLRLITLNTYGREHNEVLSKWFTGYRNQLCLLTDDDVLIELNSGSVVNTNLFAVHKCPNYEGFDLLWYDTLVAFRSAVLDLITTGAVEPHYQLKHRFVVKNPAFASEVIVDRITTEWLGYLLTSHKNTGVVESLLRLETEAQVKIFSNLPGITIVVEGGD